MHDDDSIRSASDLDLAEALRQRLEQPTTEQGRALALALDAWCSWRVKAKLQLKDSKH